MVVRLIAILAVFSIFGCDHPKPMTGGSRSDGAASQDASNDKKEPVDCGTDVASPYNVESCPTRNEDGSVDTKGVPVSEGKLGIIDATEYQASSVPAEYQDMVAQVVTKVLKPIIGEKAAKGVGDLVGYATNGLGVGVSATVGAGVGTSGAVSFALETAYHRKDGLGEIGLFCSPGVALGSGVGAEATGSYYFIKTMGCKQSGDYEGGMLTFPMSIGNYSINSGYGIDEQKIIEFLEYATKGPWTSQLSAAQLNSEMERFNNNILAQVKQSQSALEILTLAKFLIIINAALQGSSLVKAAANQDSEAAKGSGTLSAIKMLPQITIELLQSVVSFETLKSRDFPNYKTVYSRLLTKLTPEQDYPFTRAMLEKLIASLGGCDNIVFSHNTNAKGLSIGELSSSISYSYTVNPEFLGLDAQPGTPAYDDHKDKKMILELSSFADFLKPENYAKLAETLGKNIYRDAIKPADSYVVNPIKDNVYQPVKDKAVDPVTDTLKDGAKEVGGKIGSVGSSVGSLFLAKAQQQNELRLLASGSDVAAYTGLSNFGPLRFLTLIGNLADPSFVKQHCVDPGIAKSAAVGSALHEFFKRGTPPQP